MWDLGLGVDADVYASLLLDASSENRWPSDHKVMGGLLDADSEEGLSENFLPGKRLGVILFRLIPLTCRVLTVC